jgi:hypothetical protein
MLIPCVVDKLGLTRQALNVNPCEEGDPIFTCNFKTEMVCALLTINGGNLPVNIGPTYVVCSSTRKLG